MSLVAKTARVKIEFCLRLGASLGVLHWSLDLTYDKILFPGLPRHLVETQSAKKMGGI